MSVDLLDKQQTQMGEGWAAPTQTSSRDRRGGAIAAMVIGLVVVMGATVALPPALTSAKGARATELRADPAAAVFPDVTVSDDSYVPGHSSGWHVHPGLHSVVVLSGTLTIYDQECQGRNYRAGESYAGGRQPHLSRNEGTEAVVLVITYVAPPASVEHGTMVPAPSGCIFR